MDDSSQNGLIITEDFRKSAKAIIERRLNYAGSTSADRLRRSIADGVTKIADSPYGYVVRSIGKSGRRYRQFVVGKKYLIIYTVIDDQIILTHFLPGAMDVDEILRY